MKRLLNTLYVTSQGSYLSKEGETVSISIDHEQKLRLPIHTLDGIVCFGQVACSPPLMGFCAERNVSLTFLTENGKFLARVQGPVSGNVLLRREQYRRADDPEFSATVARVIVCAKIANSRNVVMRAARENPEPNRSTPLRLAGENLARLLGELRTPLPLEIVRGKEGEAAKIYFGQFDHLITTQKDDFKFTSRNRRPPLDNVNALLSFLYTLLAHDVRSALEGVGLDPAVGYLHRDRPGRPGLALDLMEEFRPILADRLVLSLINRQQIRASGFKTTETGAVIMDDETRKEVLVAYQKRKQEEIMHPFLGEKVLVGLLPHIQSLLFARFIRGDLDGYPPLFWR